MSQSERSTSSAVDAAGALKRGFWWTGSGTVVIRAIKVALTIVILQRLTYAEMGRWAEVWSVLVVVEACCALGVNFAVVRMRELSTAALRGLFSISTLWGFILAFGLAAASPLIARCYGEPAMTPLLLVVCLKLIFIGPAMVSWGILGQQLRFRDITIADTVAGVFESLTSIILVIAGFGTFGMVWGTTMRAFVYLIVMLAFAPVRPGLQLALPEVGRAVWFGVHVVASNLFYQLYRNMDYFLIGLRLGVQPLGVYRVGYDIGMSPFETTSIVATRVGYSVLSNVVGDPQILREIFGKTARSLLFFLLPIAAILAIEGRDLVATIAADRWLPAVPVLQVLCWAGVVRGFVQLFAPLFQAAGRPRLALYEAILTGTLLAGGFAIAIALAPPNEAIVWVAWVWLLVYPVVLVCDLWFARRYVALGLRDIVRALAPLIPGAIAMVVAMLLMQRLTATSLQSTPRLVVVGATGLAIFYSYKLIFLDRAARRSRQ